MQRERGFAWREYASYFGPHRTKLLWVAVAGLAQSFSYLPFAAVLRRIFDTVLPARDSRGLWIAAGELLALQLAGLVLAYWMRIASLRVNEDVVRQIRTKSLARMYELPRSFHTAADLERLHVTLVYETNYIWAMNNSLTAIFFPAALSAGALFVIMLWIEPWYAVAICVIAPVLFALDRLLERDVWFRRQALRRAFEQFSAGVRFVLTAMDLTRSQAAEIQELERQAGNVGELERISLGLSRYDAVQQLAGTSVLLIATLAVLVAGGYAVANGAVSRGEMMAFYVIAALFAAQARVMVGAVPDIRMGIRAYRELHLLLTDPAREPYQGILQADEIREIRLENVAFSYVPERPVLTDVSLEIERGSRVALIGANGSGKSSIVHLLSGYYRPDRGRVLVNGTPYDEMAIRSVRARIALVPQNPLLFAGSVRDNIIYGCAERAADLEEALEWAGAAEIVRHLPEGLNTPIGEQGIRLSGGQRQRLVIARALLRRPDVLILDEPTNHLDEEAIERLMANLDSLPFRPALLVISHEQRVLRHVDRAFRLDDGYLVPAAAHAEQGARSGSRR